MLVAGLSLLLAACGSPSTSVPGYYLPRHSGSTEGPTGAAQGTVQIQGGCFYLSGYLLIWPESYSLITTNGGISVIGDGFTVSTGYHIRLTGGVYEAGEPLPDAAKGALEVPCAGPYMWVTQIDAVEVSP